MLTPEEIINELVDRLLSCQECGFEVVTVLDIDTEFKTITIELGYMLEDGHALFSGAE